MVKIPGQLLDAMVAHARFALPDEACGLLATDEEGTLRMAFCLTNAAPSPVRYVVDPIEHHGALRYADRRGWDIAGVYHSHPRSAAYPSRRDVTEALDPEWLYVIVGTPARSSPDVRGYWIRDGDVVEVPLQPVPL